MQRFFSLLCIVVLSSAIMGCGPSKMVQDFRYLYADGSGNVYRISETAIQYDPVQAAESSSGLYSEGEADQIELSEEDFSALESLMLSAIADETQHIRQRVMLSGQITVLGEQTKVSILAPDADVKEEIEGQLKMFFL